MLDKIKEYKKEIIIVIFIISMVYIFSFCFHGNSKILGMGKKSF